MDRSDLRARLEVEHERLLDQILDVVISARTEESPQCREVVAERVVGSVHGQWFPWHLWANCGASMCSAPYAATKAAVASLTRSLAVEYAKRGLRVVALAPGGVKTALTAQTRFPEGADMSLIAKLMPLMPLAEPEEIAAAVAFLASDEARYINGAVLPIDGAQTAG